MRESTSGRFHVVETDGEVIAVPEHVLRRNGTEEVVAASNFDDVVAFQRKFGLPVGDHPRFLVAHHTAYDARRAMTHMQIAMKALYELRVDHQDDEFYGRVQMMLEELIEMIEHNERGDLAGVFDSLIDLVYFAHGTAAMHGFPWQAGWNEVQRANMTKVRVRSHAESARLNKLDVRKPEGWQPPNIHRVLEEARWRHDSPTVAPSSDEAGSAPVGPLAGGEWGTPAGDLPQG